MMCHRQIFTILVSTSFLLLIFVCSMSCYTGPFRLYLRLQRLRLHRHEHVSEPRQRARPGLLAHLLRARLLSITCDMSIWTSCHIAVTKLLRHDISADSGRVGYTCCNATVCG